MVVRNTQQKFWQKILMCISYPLVWNIGKKSIKPPSLSVLINFGNFCQILNFLVTHSNISWGNEEYSVEVSAKQFVVY